MADGRAKETTMSANASANASSITGGSTSPKTRVIDATARLLAAAAGDTAFRDLYLHRARQLMSTVMPEEAYLAAIDTEARVEAAMRQARDAIAGKDWERAKQASERAAAAKTAGEIEGATIAAAATIYTAPPVLLDPFSASLRSVARASQTLGALRDNVTRALTSLEKDDAEWSSLYRARRPAVAAIAVTESEQAQSQAGSAALEGQALAAAQGGDIKRLDHILASLIAEKNKPEEPVTEKKTLSGWQAVIPAVLATPFAARSVALAAAIGFEHCDVRPVSSTTADAIGNFLMAHAANASFATTSAPRDGVTDLREAFAPIDAGPKVSDVMVETVALFAWQIYICSSGLRYLPLAGESEYVLVEGFAPGDAADSPVLRTLQLPKRQALSRSEIEMALLRHGSILLRELELDPFTHRVVCIPPDVHARVGAVRGWGGTPEWTHLDGYRVLSKGNLLALVGGNSNFGGIADLCGIDANDRRQNTVARFAVVRRARLEMRFV
jgi:hypothetical protein